MTHPKRITPRAFVLNEQSIRFDFGSSGQKETFRTIQQFNRYLEQEYAYYIEEIVPAYETVTIFYKKELARPQQTVEEILTNWATHKAGDLLVESRTIRIPVCYDAEFSEDMERIIDRTKLTRNEIIDLHTGTSYTVHMIGFLPGFPYLSGLSEALHVPRLDQPRLLVPKGAVGIGGSQTGIYPLASPGGWNLIGRTPLDLYNPERAEPFLVRAGNRLLFQSITVEAFYELKNNPGMIKQFVNEGLK